MMVFATQVPMIFMGKKLTERISKKLDDFEVLEYIWHLEMGLVTGLGPFAARHGFLRHRVMIGGEPSACMTLLPLPTQPVNLMVTCRSGGWGTQRTPRLSPSHIAQGMWSYKGHEKEQVEMLNLLYDWTMQVPGRNIVLNGGDVHLGGLAELYRHGRFWARQMTTGVRTGFGLSEDGVAASLGCQLWKESQLVWVQMGGLVCVNE